MEFSIRDIKGIGPRKEALFARLHLMTVTDLLQYFPRDYEDRSHIWSIGQAPCGTGKPSFCAGLSPPFRRPGRDGGCRC